MRALTNCVRMQRLAGTVATAPARVPARRINHQQLAWGVLLLSFAIFCVIALFVVVGAHYFLFQSRIPMQATVHVARGTPTLIGTNLIETAVTRPSDILYNSVLATDTQSQASVSFVDQNRDNRLVATVTVQGGSSLNLRQGSRPRFDWSSDAYWFDFDDVYGEFDIFVADGADRPILINFRTTLGPSARLISGGHYTLIAAGQRVQVVNYSGDAVLIGAERRSQSISAGQTATVQVGTNEFTLLSHVDSLGDMGFTPNNVLDINAAPEQVDSQVWVCNNTVDNPDEPMGSIGLTMVEGRPALRLFRGDNAESHGATQCWHGLGISTAGLDVSSFGSVSIRATFRIVNQTLSACGTAGSECPLTLAMDYIPENGGQPVKWYHGFYAFVDPNRVFPLRCDTCSEQHEQINPGVWYT
jgi:hypothetical protein